MAAIKPLLALFAVVLIGVTLASAVDAGVALAQSAYLDPEEKFHIAWSYSDDDITITMTVNTTGWFGLGFSENGGMAGADIIVAGVQDGEAYLWVGAAELVTHLHTKVIRFLLVRLLQTRVHLTSINI